MKKGIFSIIRGLTGFPTHPERDERSGAIYCATTYWEDTKKGWLIGFWLVMFWWFVGPAHGQETAVTTSLLVQPGDTWLALSWRYGVSTAELQALNPHPNLQRQPVIGDVLLVPATAERRGKLDSTATAGVLATAVRHGVSPWQIAADNGLPLPSTPTFGRPLFIATGEEPPRQYPPLFTSLAVSHPQAYPGEGLAVRGQLATPSWPSAQIRLGTAVGDMLANGPHVVGLLGTGAFFQPGTPELTIAVAGQPLWAQPWRMAADKAWTYNQMTLTGTAAEITQEAIAAERTRLAEIWNQISGPPQWETPFQEPITSYLAYSSFYGARRSYNGGPYSTYHEGLDFSAYGGTDVLAPAGGTVVLAEFLYVRGGAVIIDHGLGIYTGLYHLSGIVVDVGQVVGQGEVVGKVGSTGFSTGNHLHWDLLVSGEWVDPMAWREQATADWILAAWGGE